MTGGQETISFQKKRMDRVHLKSKKVQISLQCSEAQ